MVGSRFSVLVFTFTFISIVFGVSPIYKPPAGQEENIVNKEEILPTVTVHGFSNFRTTVDGTVIIFTPSTSAASEASQVPEVPLPKHENVLEQNNNVLDAKPTHHSEDDEIFRSVNEIGSREPSPPILQSSFSSANPHSKIQKKSPSSMKTPKLTINDESSKEENGNAYPTGLVTVLGGTQINTGFTTVFETKVIGTYINGNYAQILQSTSKIFSPESNPNSAAKTSSISPTKINLPYIAATSTLPTVKKEIKLNRHISAQRKIQPEVKEIKAKVPTASNKIYTSFEGPPSEKVTVYNGQVTEKIGNHATKPARINDVNTNSLIVPSETRNLQRNITRRRFNRFDRFRFRNNPRPKSQLAKLNRFKVRPTIRNHKLLLSTLKSQSLSDVLKNSVPIDPANLIWKTSVVTKEVTLHLGRRKSVRTLTVTTTIPVTREFKPTLANYGDDIYASPAANNHLVATAPPFGGLSEDGATPPMRVLTRTFSETEVSANTALVPVFDGESTTMHTVTESFFIRKMITAYRTMPPGEVYGGDESHENHYHDNIHPNSQLLVAESQLQTDASIGIHSNSLDNKLSQPLLQTSGLEELIKVKQALNSQSLLSALQSSNLQPLDPLRTLRAALSSNPLAAAYLGINLGIQPQLYSTSTITRSSSVISTDAVYSTRTIPVFDGKRTIYKTLSEFISSTERTVTSYQTETVPYLNTDVLAQQQQLQKLIAPSLPPQYSTVTSTYTTVTEATSYNSKVYRLVYNALSTKFRTVTSSSIYTTTIIATSTSKIPIQPTNYPIYG